MSKLRVHSFSISIDGYGAGPDQDLENPLGVGGLKVFDWFFPTRTWQRMHGSEDGETGIDDNVAAKGFEGIGGNKEIGEGRMEIIESAPPSTITIKMGFIKSLAAQNTVEFTFDHVSTTTTF